MWDGRQSSDSVVQSQIHLFAVLLQDKEKAKLEENRAKVIERTKAIIEQAEKMRNAPVGAGHFPCHVSAAHILCAYLHTHPYVCTI